MGRPADWFTVEKLEEGTFAISEYKHWEKTHCYLLLGSRSALLIDTGLGVAPIHDAVASLTSLPVQVATTHAHWDHIGGHKYFQDIAVHQAELPWLSGSFPLPLQAVKQALTQEPCAFPPGFDLAGYQIYQGGMQAGPAGWGCDRPGRAGSHRTPHPRPFPRALLLL